MKLEDVFFFDSIYMIDGTHYSQVKNRFDIKQIKKLLEGGGFSQGLPAA